MVCRFSQKLKSDDLDIVPNVSDNKILLVVIYNFWLPNYYKKSTFIE